MKSTGNWGTRNLMIITGTSLGGYNLGEKLRIGGSNHKNKGPAPNVYTDGTSTRKRKIP